MAETQKGNQYSKGSDVQGLLVATFEHSLDPKWRLTIPACWREIMGMPGYLYAMIAPQKGNLLILFPPLEMERMVQRLRDLPMTTPGRMEAMRYIGGNSEQVFFDVQGRIRVSDRLLKAGRLTDRNEKVVLLGALDRIELWPKSLAPQTEEIKGEEMLSAFQMVGF
ncbi:MAG: hypothetical protein J6U40_00345 [Kiritimatiellae bacterium]|nr:hypothetical protein [Kiritimatiellia bacterium]MBP5227190.1 hypothetical protein [Kiritimatiellia bacterium]